MCSVLCTEWTRCFKQIWKVGKVGKEGKVGKIGKVGRAGKVGKVGTTSQLSSSQIRCFLDRKSCQEIARIPQWRANHS